MTEKVLKTYGMLGKDLDQPKLIAYTGCRLCETCDWRDMEYEATGKLPKDGMRYECPYGGPFSGVTRVQPTPDPALYGKRRL